MADDRTDLQRQSDELIARMREGFDRVELMTPSMLLPGEPRTPQIRVWWIGRRARGGE
jgi:hypothetical protein